MFKPGDIAFFKEARKGVKKSSPGAKTQGHFFGVVLGVVPPFAKEPPADQLMNLMGQAGFVSFDDVGNFLGNAAGAKLLAAFEMRYFGKTGLPQFLTLREKIILWFKSWFKPTGKALPKPEADSVNEEGPIEGHPPQSLLGKPTGLVDPRGRPIVS